MNILKKILKFKLYIIIVVVYLLTFLFSNKISNRILKADYSDFISTLLIFPAIFVLLGLIDAWIDKKTMTKLVGENSGVKGVVLSYLLGVIGVGPLYVAFPVAIILIKKGISIKNVYVFLGSWSTTKIPQLLIEASSMGVKYTLIRLIFNITGIVIIALIMNVFITEDEKKQIVDKNTNEY